MRKAIILTGLPGSGKSTIAEQLVAAGAAACSADYYFIKEGVYRYVPAEIGLAHAACMRAFVNHITGNVVINVAHDADIVVDNTNTTSVEIAPYVAVANAFGWEHEIIRVECDPEVAFARQTHGVSRATFHHMERNLKQPLPPWWNVVKK